MSANTPEPKPQPNDNPAIWALVLEDVPRVFSLGAALADNVRASLMQDMRARDDRGRAKYGTPLQAFNGRNPWTDAYQEALDVRAYAKQMDEEAETTAEKDGAWAVYLDFMNLAYRLKRAAMIRQGWTP